MSNIPPSADLSKLKNILGNAKNLINMDANNAPSPRGKALPSPRQQQQQTQHRDGFGPGQDIQYISEADMLRATQGQPQVQQQQQQHTMGDPTRRPGPISEEAIMNSNLPESVKQAYINNPIPQATMNHTFNLDDVSELVEPRPTQQRLPKQRVNENSIIKNPNDTFTVSEAALRGIIKDVLVEYLAADYTKNLTEATIKKTINTLIKEGKIKPKVKK